MFKYIFGGFVALLILWSMIVIFKSELSPQTTFKKTETIKTTKPVSVNIDLDSKFNNFKSHTGLTFENLPCQLYEELNKHVSSIGKLASGSYDSVTAQLLLSLIKQINKVKSQKNILQNIKVTKPKKISIDTTKLDNLFNSLVKTKNTIDNRQQQIKLLKDNFKPSVVSGKQWQIDVQKQFITYLKKRLLYLKSLKPKTTDSTKEDINQIQKTLEVSEMTLNRIVDDIDQNKNVQRYDDEINQLQNLKNYWVLRLQEVNKCQKTDKGYRSDQGNNIYRQLDRLRLSQQQHDNSDYCMELRKHLVLKLIKEFDVIQSDFNCIKQKSRVQRELSNLEAKLEILHEKNKKASGFNPNRHNEDLQKLKKNYDDINSALEYGIKRIEVGYDSNILKQIIQNTENDLRDHESRLNQLLKDDSNKQYSEDPDRIVKLVDMNLQLKEDYCKEYQEYEKENLSIRHKIDQASAERKIQQVSLERYFSISESIKKSLQAISLIKEQLIIKLERI